MFNVGDQVKVASLKGSHLPKSLVGKDGEVVIVTSVPNGSKQWCRVQFSERMFDYEDLGSWSLEINKESL